jgi:pimeloyl-ACP methyl ester carboxylesterase
MNLHVFLRIRRYIFLPLFIVTILFLSPSRASAALTLPTTPCDQAQIDVSYSGISQHLTTNSVRENGTIAFKYGSDNNHFVTHQGDVFNFNVTTLFAPSSPFAAIKLMALDSACNLVFGLGPLFSNINPLTENILSYDINTHVSTLNGLEQISNIYGGSARYLWVEVWDGINGSSVATYSYLVDVNNPLNPTEGVQPEPTGKRPIIIVPGIVGTELYNGDVQVWPNIAAMILNNNDYFLTENLGMNENGVSIKQILVGNVMEEINIPILRNISIFKGLVNKLESGGYNFNSDYFFFPYDWRADLNDVSELLKNKINAVKSQTGFQKVDIIAHSMGGLVVEDYIKSYGKTDIDKLIFVGTPHLGAPKAAKVLLEGDRFNNPFLEEDRIQEIAINSPSVYELLPTPKYFEDFVGYIKKYYFITPPAPLNYSETKSFLVEKGFNSTLYDKADNFFAKSLDNIDYSGLNVYNIAGCKRDTQAGYQFAIFNSFISGIRTTTGDETVPMVSAQAINIPNQSKYYVKNGEHTELPSTSGVKELILGILSGNIPANTGTVSTESSFCGYKGKEAVWKSPVEVHIYDSSGHHTGPIENNGIEYGIDGVTYEVIGHQKFVFMPTDEGQQYQIVAKGLGDGTFDLRISEKENGNITHSTIFNDVAITPTSVIKADVSDQTSDETIQVDKLGTSDFMTVQADTLLDAGQSEDLIPPQTQSVAMGKQGSNGWYTSSTTIEMTATDDNSGVLGAWYSIDGGVNYIQYTQPITIAQNGNNELKYYSVDKAGNNEEIKTLEIRIDSIAPEIISEFSTSTKDFLFTATDNLDPNPRIICASTSCTASDSAGNQTVLTFKKDKILTLRTLRLKTLAYNNQSQTLPDNALVVNYWESKGNLLDFNQTFLLKNQELARITYVKKSDQSIITRLTRDGITRETVGGMKILQIKTATGSIGSGVK